MPMRLQRSDLSSGFGSQSLLTNADVGLRHRMGFSKEALEECRAFIADADYLVCRLPVEFEIKLRFWSPISPVREALELFSSERASRCRKDIHGQAYTRSLARHVGDLGEEFS